MLRAELGPQPPDVDVDGAGAAEEVVAPDLLEQLGAGEDAAGVLGEVLEELELLVREVERAPAQAGGVGRLVDDELAEHQRALGAGAVGGAPGPQQAQPGVHLGRARAGQQHLVDAPLEGHGDEAALGEDGDHRDVQAGGAQQATEAAGGGEVVPGVDQHGVVRAGIEQGRHLGGGGPESVG